MITVLGDRVLVALPPREDETVSAGGIVLVKDPDRFYAPSRGIVVQVGEKSGTVNVDDVLASIAEYWRGLSMRIPTWNPLDGKWTTDLPARDVRDEVRRLVEALRPASFDVQEGDCVLFPRSVGEEVSLDGIDYVILRESDLIGIVEPKDTAA